MALPILGHIQNMRTISRDDILNYHDSNYIGDNIILVASGPINHKKLVEDTMKYIQVKKTSDNRNKNSNKPVFQEGVLAL
jgi:predicted Zn-dependent peptidase